MSSFIVHGAELYPMASLPLLVVRTWNATHPRHGHDFEELVLLVSGEATQWLYPPDSEQARRVELAQGDVFWVPRGWTHSYEAAREFEIYNVLFDGALLDKWNANGPLLRALAGQETGAGQMLLESWSLRRTAREALEVLLRAVARELALRQSGFEMMAQARFIEALVLLERLVAADSPAGPHAAPHDGSNVEHAMTFIEERFHEPIALRDIARAVHLSPNYLCEVFSRATGQSPGRFLLRVRLEHARFLLLTTSRPITEIALSCGFSDSSYFARAFKAFFGHAPSRLRTTGR